MARAVVRRPGEGDELRNPVGGSVTFKARGEETGGRVMALETVAAPGEGPPLHVHAGEDESLYVLEGEVRFRLGDDEHVAPAGSFVLIPEGLPHTWQNAGGRPARMLVHFTPAGMERFFEAFAAAPAPGPEAFARAGAPAGMTVLGPPLGAPGAPT